MRPRQLGKGSGFALGITGRGRTTRQGRNQSIHRLVQVCMCSEFQMEVCSPPLLIHQRSPYEKVERIRGISSVLLIWMRIDSLSCKRYKLKAEDVVGGVLEITL